MKWARRQIQCNLLNIHSGKYEHTKPYLVWNCALCGKELFRG